MLDKEEVVKDLDELIEIREEFLKYLDANIPKKENDIEYDFSQNPTLDAQKVFEHFFKLDYKARKLRGFLVKELGLHAQ